MCSEDTPPSSNPALFLVGAIMLTVLAPCVSAGDRHAGGSNPAPVLTKAIVASDRFTDLSGAAHRPAEVGDSKANVLFFVMADCPVSNNYAPEINAIAKAYRDRGVSCYIVYVDAEFAPDEARRHAEDYRLAPPVVLDPEHRLVRFANARIAPSAAIVLPGQTVAYCGRIDNRYADYGKRRVTASQHDLRDALDAILAGRAVTGTPTEPIGCHITSKR
jgi:hypothetical protein